MMAADVLYEIMEKFMKSIIDWIVSRKIIPVTSSGGSIALLVLRVWVGLIMAFAHGLGKLSNFGEYATRFADPFGLGPGVTLGLAVFAEFFCALAIAFGLFTRAAAVPLIITMFTAAFVIHGDDPFGKKELALLFMAPFVTLLIAGPGKYSLDRIFARFNLPSQ